MTLETLELKRFSPSLKLADTPGNFSAVIATLNVVDKDGDVTLPGFFGEQSDVKVLVGHDWGMVPIGKGRIYESDDKAIFEGKLNLKDPAAEQAYEWLKFDFAEGSPSQEFSYGWRFKQGGFRFGEHEDESVRFLTPLDDGSPGAEVHEVSLVLVGAGEGTGTQDVKTEKMKFSVHAEAVLAAVGGFKERAKSLADLRAKDERTLSEENVEKIQELRDELDGILETQTPKEEGSLVDLPSSEAVDLLLAQTQARMAGRI